MMLFRLACFKKKLNKKENQESIEITKWRVNIKYSSATLSIFCHLFHISLKNKLKNLVARLRKASSHNSLFCLLHQER